MNEDIPLVFCRTHAKNISGTAQTFSSYRPLDDSVCKTDSWSHPVGFFEKALEPDVASGCIVPPSSVGALDMQNRRWRIGELAAATGMTVRALHHYERTGLLTAAERTEGDHRLYDDACVERLYRIRALRGLGMSLEEIRKAIGDGSALADLLRAQLDRVEQEVDRMTRLRDRLRNITKAGTQVSADDLLATLDAMSRIERHAHMRQRNRTAKDGEPEAQWRALAEDLRACMNAGEPPSSPRVRALAAQAQTLIEAFAEGDPKVLDALATLRASDPPDDLAGWNPDLIRYLDRALAALNDSSQNMNSTGSTAEC